jgi:Obg family GTPase CgtA
LADRLLTGLSGDDLAVVRNEHIGFVFQFHYLLPEFSVLHNVMMPGLKLGQKSREEVEFDAMKQLRLLGVDDQATKKATQISGGQKQRVAIARALINEPKIIMCIAGNPNAGKSTLLSVITAAKPKIADYAFTTLVPQLGMVDYRDGKSFCIADLPGIIEGAAEGKGLGHRFLRHIERNSILLFLIPADCADHKKEFEILVNELKEYNAEMLQKDFVIAVSKNDMLDDELRAAISKELPKKIPHIFISSITGQGLPELKDLLWKTLNAAPKEN